MSSARLRAMLAGDAEALLALQQAAYPPSHHESWAVLGRKLALWPAGCWVLEDGSGLLGYLFSHPGRRDAPPLLHAELQLPARPDAYAIHDLAMHPRAQGRGLAALLIAQALREAEAADLRALSLVAVLGSAGFWARQGFAVVEPAPPQLASYGGDAIFMLRSAGAESPARL